MKNSEKIYLVQYSKGSYEYYIEMNIFATKDEYKAKKYVEKFNRILEKWKVYLHDKYEDEFYKENEDNSFLIRWYQISDINNCFYNEIEIR